VGFALAAIPAMLLPISFVVVCGYGLWASVTGYSVHVRPIGIQVLGWAGIYGTAVQLPFYMLWALASRRLYWRHRVLLVLFLFVANMLAVPVFLYAKYSGRL
jgi:hypothetical protein